MKKNVVKKSVSILPHHYEAAVLEAEREGHNCISRILQNAMRFYFEFRPAKKPFNRKALK